MLRERLGAPQRDLCTGLCTGRSVEGVPPVPVDPRDLGDDAEGHDDGHDDDHDDDTPPYWEAGLHLPPDARRMGLTHHVPDGALLDFASRLESSNRRHRITAWVMLVVFGLPVVFAVVRVLQLF